MTAIAGLLCRDGIVLISDSAATTVIEHAVASVHQMRKIEVLENRLVLAVAGPSGIAQQYEFAMRTLARDPQFDAKESGEVMNLICGQMTSVVSERLNTAIKRRDATGEPFDGSWIQAASLVAVRIAGRPHLFHVDGGLGIEEVIETSPFVVIGSGAVTTHAFIEYLRQTFLGSERPDLGDGILTLLWALKFAVLTGARDVGGKPQITIVPADSSLDIRQLDDDDLAEHEEVLSRAEAVLLDLRSAIRGRSRIFQEQPTSPEQSRVPE